MATYTDAEKIQGFDYLHEKRRRSKDQFDELLEKYRDLRHDGATLDAGDVLADLQKLYYDTYFLK